GCSKEFYGYWGNELEVAHCAGDLYFNPITLACEAKEKVPKCNDANDAKLDCGKVAEGWYAKGCSQEFNGCWDNEVSNSSLSKGSFESSFRSSSESVREITTSIRSLTDAERRKMFPSEMMRKRPSPTAARSKMESTPKDAITSSTCAGRIVYTLWYAPVVSTTIHSLRYAT
ncbi:hypothetical protein PENTCL1PPCAC_19073, partial [Pristionchus entomophagus]